MKTFEELMKEEKSKLLGCVHCGLCLTSCPTFRISGDENNSPRGRLAMWRALSENKIEDDAIVEHYTKECVGCLACETVCPSNVEYGEIIHTIKETHYHKGKGPGIKEKFLGRLAELPAFQNSLTLPARLFRKLGLPFSSFVFNGNSPIFQSSISFANQLNKKLNEKKNTIGYFTGCLTEGVYRELNFATIRILNQNNIEVIVPKNQKCCGAAAEHMGLPANEDNKQTNQQAFSSYSIVVSNTSGCSYELSKSNKGKVFDVIYYLNSLALKKGNKLPYDKIFVDLPCHSYHGLKNQQPPKNFLDSLGVDWSLAPNAELCCGAGGSYQVTHTENSNAIAEDKGAFLSKFKGQKIVLATGNPVCLMQWNRYVKNKNLTFVKVKHFAELLDESYQLAGFYA